MNLINTGIAVATKVCDYLYQNDMLSNETNDYIKIVISKKNDNFKKEIKNIVKSSKRLDITSIN